MSTPTPNRHRRATAALALAGVLALGGCSGEKKEAQVVSTSDETRTTVFGAADQAMQLFRTLNPDLRLELDYIPDADDRWSDCSDEARVDTDPPNVIQWLAARNFVVEPKRETATMIDPVVAQLVAEGWTAKSESTGNGGRSINLTRDGYTVVVGGNTEADPVRIATVGVNVSSPCIDAPADILEWKADPSPPPLG